MEQIKVGDRVTQKYEIDSGVFGWHGIVVDEYKNNPDVCWVDWEERKRTKKIKRRGIEQEVRILKESIITARKDMLKKIK